MSPVELEALDRALEVLAEARAKIASIPISEEHGDKYWDAYKLVKEAQRRLWALRYAEK